MRGTTTHGSPLPADLEALTLDELRRRRDAISAEEEDLSYRRRLLHAQLDIVGAAGQAADREHFEEMLAEVLADAPPDTVRAVRAVDVADHAEEVEVDPLPADVIELAEPERAALLDRLRLEEEEVSRRRRALLAELDRCQEELVRRFQRDGVDARALLGEDG